MGFISGKVCLVQRSWLAEEGEGNGRARSLRGLGGFRSHRHSGLRQQLQRAGHADARGHGQQPARIVLVMSPLQEQRRFISPKRGMISSRHLPLSHFLAPGLCSASFPAPLLRKRSRERARRARGGAQSLLRPDAAASGRAVTDCKGVTRTVDCVQLNPKGLCVDLIRNVCSKRL